MFLFIHLLNPFPQGALKTKFPSAYIKGERAGFSGQEHRETPLMSQGKRTGSMGGPGQLFQTNMSIPYSLKPLDFKMFSNVL